MRRPEGVSNFLLYHYNETSLQTFLYLSKQYRLAQANLIAKIKLLFYFWLVLINFSKYYHNEFALSI